MPSGGGISIHPPLTGRDGAARGFGTAFPISIHPPLAGRDPGTMSRITIFRQFQSTRPLRGGTSVSVFHVSYPPISIHPPLAGRDSLKSFRYLTILNFNPPAPCGAGQMREILGTNRYDFNPPAPCGAGLQFRHIGEPVLYFNPPAPCGAGPTKITVVDFHASFQSTRPLRGGTVWLYLGCCG